MSAARPGGGDGTAVAHDVMLWDHDRTATATAEYIVMEPVPPRALVRAAVRLATTLVSVVVCAYCLATAWDVLRDLGRVSLADAAQALRVVSVRDAILCTIGFRLARDLLTTLLETRKAR